MENAMRAIVLGAAALVVSAASASAQIYTTPDYGYAETVADLAAPADGYAAPAPPPAYTAPPVYAAPVYTAPPVYVVPAPVYVAPLVPRYYAAPVISQPPVVSRPIYAYAPGYWGGYGHGWRGYDHRYGWRYQDLDPFLQYIPATGKKSRARRNASPRVVRRYDAQHSICPGSTLADRFTIGLASSRLMQALFSQEVRLVAA